MNKNNDEFFDKQEDFRSLILEKNSNIDLTNITSFALTKKLSIIEKYDEIIELFIKVPYFFNRLISRYFPLNINLLSKYENVWEFGGSLSQNENIIWTQELVFSYAEKLNWNGLRSNISFPWNDDNYISLFSSYIKWDGLGDKINLPLSEQFVNKYCNLIDWQAISKNPKYPWSDISFFERFIDYWDWNSLSANTGILWSEELIEKYYDKWNWYYLSSNMSLPWNHEFIKKYENNWNWSVLSNNESLPWCKEFILENIHKWNWYYLSLNKNVFIDFELFDILKDKIDWMGLSANKGLFWSKELISKYEDKWDWNELSINPSLPWDENLIEKYINKWDWDNLSFNDSLPWSIDFINKYFNNWDWYTLGQGILNPMTNLWESSFKNYVSVEMIIETINYLESLDILDKTKFNYDLHNNIDNEKIIKTIENFKIILNKANININKNLF